jgi:hypothetical protein
MFHRMKGLSLALLAGVLLSIAAFGAAEQTARAAADRDAAEERYRILTASIDDLAAAQLELRRHLDRLAEAIQRVDADARSKPGADRLVSREEFTKLAESVREIDRKREADKREILERIEELGKTLSARLRDVARSTPPVVEPTRPAPRDDTPGTQEGVWYVIEKGNTLTEIISAHNAQFKAQGRRTDLQLILDANPKLKPTAMPVGAKVFIPMVPLSPRS